jgi:histidinol phosphatase-like enzyme
VETRHEEEPFRSNGIRIEKRKIINEGQQRELKEQSTFHLLNQLIQYHRLLVKLLVQSNQRGCERAHAPQLASGGKTNILPAQLVSAIVGLKHDPGL